MKVISHRGNLTGPQPDKENTPEYIHSALNQGIDCEIDLWLIDGKLYTGHDSPENLVTNKFIYDERLWIHAKNLEALRFLCETGLHYFWHEEDKFTLTSKNYIWTYTGEKTCNRSIIVDNSREWINNPNNTNCFGVCTDYPLIPSRSPA